MTALEARKAVWEKDSNSITKELYNHFQNKIQEAVSHGLCCCTVKIPTNNNLLKIQSVLNLLKAEGFYCRTIFSDLYDVYTINNFWEIEVEW